MSRFNSVRFYLQISGAKRTYLEAMFQFRQVLFIDSIATVVMPHEQVSIPLGSIYRSKEKRRLRLCIVSIPLGSIYSLGFDKLTNESAQFQFRQVLFIGRLYYIRNRHHSVSIPLGSIYSAKERNSTFGKSCFNSVRFYLQFITRQPPCDLCRVSIPLGSIYRGAFYNPPSGAVVSIPLGSIYRRLRGLPGETLLVFQFRQVLFIERRSGQNLKGLLRFNSVRFYLQF